MTKYLFILFAIVFSTEGFAQSIPEKWLTYYEKSDFKKTPRYEETMQYCRDLEAGSPWIKVTSFGKSPQGRDLPLVIVSKDKNFDPKKAAASGKAIVMIQSGIHAGEIDGKDASLMLMRDIAITKTKAALLDHVILLIIPIFNVDGHERFGKYNRINQDGPEEMGWRVTAQNLNLNRDYMKADSPEMQGWLKLFNAWLPEFFVDCHVTDGADYQYAITYGIETQFNLSDGVKSWINDSYLPTLTEQMKEKGTEITPYVFFVDDRDQMKGLSDSPSPPRFSTGYTPLQNRPGLLIETHMLKNYKTRVDGTYKMLESTISIVNDDYKELRQAVREADEETIAGVDNQYPIQFDVDNQHPGSILHFLGYKSRVEKSEISGGDWVIYSHDAYEADLPRYDSVFVTKAIDPPKAYLIPQQFTEVINRLKIHGVKLERLTSSLDLEVEIYRMKNLKWQQQPYEGRHPVSFAVEKSKEKRNYSEGTIVAWMNQRTAKVIIHALEPEAPDAFVRWGFFDACFEQKEYAENYVMEKMAREMLAKDSGLKAEFEERVRTDTTFAKSPDERLNFFYQHSPYWDKQMNVYPVARLMWEVPLPTEPVK